jgi:hypothetical protein
LCGEIGAEQACGQSHHATENDTFTHLLTHA